MFPSPANHGHRSESRRTREISSVAAGIACCVWGGVAAGAGLSFLALFAIDRSGADDVNPPLLFRLIGQAWFLLDAIGARRLPSLDIVLSRLFLYANRDFVDAFLIGSALVAFTFAAALWMTFQGLGRGYRWAFRSVVVVSSFAAVALAACAAWCITHGASAEVPAVLVIAAAVPAVLAVALLPRAVRPEEGESPVARRRNRLTRPVLLLLIWAHALLLLPALAYAWVLVGVLVRQVWLAWEA